jgi:hypothetical protein
MYNDNVFLLFRKFADIMMEAEESRMCLEEATEIDFCLFVSIPSVGYHLDRTDCVTTGDKDKGSLLEIY